MRERQEAHELRTSHICFFGAEMPTRAARYLYITIGERDDRLRFRALRGISVFGVIRRLLHSLMSFNLVDTDNEKKFKKYTNVTFKL